MQHLESSMEDEIQRNLGEIDIMTREHGSMKKYTEEASSLLESEFEETVSKLYFDLKKEILERIKNTHKSLNLII